MVDRENRAFVTDNIDPLINNWDEIVALAAALKAQAESVDRPHEKKPPSSYGSYAIAFTPDEIDANDLNHALGQSKHLHELANTYATSQGAQQKMEAASQIVGMVRTADEYEHKVDLGGLSDATIVATVVTHFRPHAAVQQR